MWIDEMSKKGNAIVRVWQVNENCRLAHYNKDLFGDGPYNSLKVRLDGTAGDNTRPCIVFVRDDVSDIKPGDVLKIRYKAIHWVYKNSGFKHYSAVAGRVINLDTHITPDNLLELSKYKFN